MYIQMVSMHGLVRAQDIEMGRDADTGGQIRYVIDLINELSKNEEITKIDLFTRQIKDKRVSTIYSQHIEEINAKSRIVRLTCGGQRYMRKEKLWPYLDEFVDRMIAFTNKEKMIPDIIHGHYADAGYVAKEIAAIFGIPFIFTGHSLGRNKLEFLQGQNWSREKADRVFNIEIRIKREEAILANADLVITSTRFERDHLYTPYSNRTIPIFEVIPPGLDFKRFFPYYEYELPSNHVTEQQKLSYITMQKELQRFHINVDKPLILTLCRPDTRKNIDLLIKVYGEDPELQAIANLAIFAGIREDINTMEESEKQVLTDILLLMDRYDLYGKLAIPKHHNPRLDVPELYRVAAHKQGIFVSTAFLENFGLTFIEASAAGLPFIACDKGGPKDIVKNCENGILVDMNKPAKLVAAMKKLLLDREEWNRLSRNGVEKVRTHYSWESHCRKYMETIKTLKEKATTHIDFQGKEAKTIGKRLNRIKYLFITDIDDTLIGGDSQLDDFKAFMQRNRDTIGFGVATGRPINSALEVLEEIGLDNFDIIISSVGTEIYYRDQQKPDKGWANHIGKKWKPRKIKALLDACPLIACQEDADTQRDFKISYDLKKTEDQTEALPRLHTLMTDAHLAYNLIFSHGAYIDIIPFRASKGKAIRYLSSKWKIPLERIICAGNSGNDKDMLTGSIYGIVVGNYEAELEELRRTNRVYFATANYSDGIMEGLAAYAAQYKSDFHFDG